MRKARLPAPNQGEKMKLKAAILLAAAGLLTLSSCVSMQTKPPSYSSNAPEERGERAILSNIEMVGEIVLKGQTLGIFYSDETYSAGKVQNVLFVLKGNGSVFSGSGIDAYQFYNSGSITTEQANKLISALDDYLAKNPADLTKDQLYNFELVAGILDMKDEGTYRRFNDITFVINYSVTNKGKIFRTIFPGVNGYIYFELTDPQVQALRETIAKALSKKPSAASKPNA